MLIIHSPLFWRLRVDRLKRSVDQCGRKTFYAFTKRIRVDGAGTKCRQSLHWHWQSFPLQALTLFLNSLKLVECLIETRNVHHNCGPPYRALSEPYITDLTLGKLKIAIISEVILVGLWTEYFFHIISFS